VIPPSNWSRFRRERRAKPDSWGLQEIRRSVIVAKTAKLAMASWTMPGIRSP
jgi:hypothetical protein